MRWFSTAILIILKSESSSAETVEFGRIVSRKAKALKEEPTPDTNKAPKAAKEEDADPEFEEWSDANTMTSMSLELPSLSMSLPDDWDVFEVPSDSMSMTAEYIYGEWGIDALEIPTYLDSTFSFSLSFSFSMIETDDAESPIESDDDKASKAGKMDKTKAPVMSKTSKQGVVPVIDEIETESTEDWVDMDKSDFVETQLLSSSGSFVRVVSSGSCAIVGSALMLSYVLGFFLF